jgi:DNA polymerase-4
VSGRRSILHVDMDAFFAAVEQRDDPTLRGKPVLIDGAGPRGVVATASYEARRFGCHSAQPMAIALRKCPEAIVVAPRGGVYHDVSRAIFEVMGTFTPAVEPLSVDEAFLDLTGTDRLHGSPAATAERIKQRIHEVVGLTASVGVAPNKFLAKIASDLEKPDALVVIDDEWIATRLPELAVSRMWGVGPAGEARLASIGVRTFGDLQAMGEQRLADLLGSNGPRLWRLSHGRDDRAVARGEGARSISHEQTFGTDVADRDAVRAVLLRQVEAVARRVRRAGVHARTITLKIRFGDYRTISRSRTIGPTDVTEHLWTHASAVFDDWARSGFEPVRLIGFGASHLGETAEPGLFFEAPVETRSRAIDAATDAIRDKFGARSVFRGESGLSEDGD